jgi:hypothetical protein
MNAQYPYLIANPLTPDAASRTFRGEHFDVLGPETKTQYSEVFWRSQPVALPQEIIDRFDGKVMAVTGMETDIVRVLPNGSHVPVPCFEQYNHHWSGWMRGKGARVLDEDERTAPPVLGSHGEVLPQVEIAASDFPQQQVFSEGNGNEHRRSFKGYAEGFAQLIESPATWANSPMIININKRLTGETTPGPVAALQPRYSLAPQPGPYNGVLECPCTSRKPRVLDAYHAEAEGSRVCGGVLSAVVETAEECAAAAPLAFGRNMSRALNDSRLPIGCFAAAAEARPRHAAPLRPRVTTPPSASAGPLQQPLAAVPARGRRARHARRRAAPRVPQRERQRREHRGRGAPARLAPPPVASPPSDRRPAAQRFNPGKCAAYPASELLEEPINPICNVSAYGGGLMCCTGGSLLLDAEQAVPEEADTYRLSYRFYFEEHTAQANLFRTWWSTEACAHEEGGGGPRRRATRAPATNGSSSSILHAALAIPPRQATNNEYSVPKSAADCLDPATPHAECTHTLHSRFRGKDLFGSCMATGAACADVGRIAQRDGGWFQMVYAAAHCHSPACESMELWDDDTHTLLCRNAPIYGGGGGTHDEEHFAVGIPPCVWGSAAEGLHTPPRVHLDSNLSCVKKANATNGHWGVMSLWQMRSAYLSQ